MQRSGHEVWSRYCSTPNFTSARSMVLNSDTLVSSRLLEYELWNRLHARGLVKSHGDAAKDLLLRLAFLELAPPVLSRALEPFPLEARVNAAKSHLAAAHVAPTALERADYLSIISGVAGYFRHCPNAAQQHH